MEKNPGLVFFGIFLVSMLFVPPSIPFMVPEAEAAPMDSPADAITNLSLVSISKYNNQSNRNNITLSWSAPNDNGGAISQYVVQVHQIESNDWSTLDNNIQGTTYTHSNAAVGYQFSYRVWALSPDGCVGEGNMQAMTGCNESNILHVVSLPDAASGTPTSQCNNSDLDDCGHFTANLYWTNISITSSSGGTTITPGDTAHIEATLVCSPCLIYPNSLTEYKITNSHIEAELFYPDDIGWDGTANTGGTLRQDFGMSTTNISPQGTVFTADILMHDNSDTVAGDYTVKLKVDDNEFLDDLYGLFDDIPFRASRNSKYVSSFYFLM